MTRYPQNALNRWVNACSRNENDRRTSCYEARRSGMQRCAQLRAESASFERPAVQFALKRARENQQT